ncbi:ATP-binding protein [Candidatus Poriferisodalis sp.]|uniref:ATP-binding protein n=1 Tax=Candidatus Poriferisodalis sp. TaxID=3101277 RepID=UPI003B5197E9
MAEYQRSYVTVLLERLSEVPSRLIAVFGPRQSGKTTIVRQALAQSTLVRRYEAVDEPDRSSALTSTPRLAIPDFSSEPRDAQWLLRTWEESRQSAWESPNGAVLVLDEIQKIPRWSEIVKGLWDADRAKGCPLHVVILGSAPLLMQSGLTESLAGRFEMIAVTHWSFAEMAAAFGFSVDEFVFFGGYPGTAPLIGDVDRWSRYVLASLVQPNIERDVLAMTRVDKPVLLARLLELGALYSGQELSFNKMLGPLQDAGNTTTLARYLDLLGAAGLLVGLAKHTERPIIRRSSSPKLNVLNTALMSSIARYSFEEARSDRTFWGRLCESAVGAHLLNTASSRTAVRYWRDRGSEVDFVLQRGPRVVGIEVKSGRSMPRSPGASVFERRFGALPTVLVGDHGVPFEDFLLKPADHWLDSS